MKETNQIKSRFLALASHELRTPLGIILGCATFLQRDAFVNLLNNAIRFSPVGSKIVVGARVQGDQILAWVQVHGLGIGLTIAKGLIEAQRGKISRVFRLLSMITGAV